MAISNRLIIAYFIITTVATAAMAQSSAVNPPTRPRIDDLQKESSSFVADPDPLDPLPLKVESLKEDEEPVLEDIRQILNATIKADEAKKKESVKTENNIKAKIGAAPAVKKKLISQPNIKKTNKSKLKKQIVQKKNVKNKIKKTAQQTNADQLQERTADEPDVALENRLHKTYQKYNIEPTSAEQWSKVNAGRNVEVFIVEKGNTLESISRTLFGDSYFWPKIWALNHADISNPHIIYPGLKIYFYPATVTELPSLNVGAPSAPFDPTILASGPSLDGRDYKPQQTDFEKFSIKYQRGNKRNFGVPQPLPESLPIVSAKEFFVGRKTVKTIIDIRDAPELPVGVPNNPYVLTSVKPSPDFEVGNGQIDELICHEGQFVSKVNKLNPQAVPGQYLLVEPLTNDLSRLKKTFMYKIVGQAEISDSLQMRVKSCQNLMNSETLIVSEEKILNSPEPTEKFTQTARLVEGLDAPSQDFFSFGQLVILSTGPLSTTPGQKLDIFSESAGAVVGQVQVIKNTGTMTIGFFTKVSELIKIGDLVNLTDQQTAEKSSPELEQSSE